MTRAIRSRRDAGAWAGRTDTNKRVVFDDVIIASSSSASASARAEMGSYVAVRVDSSNGITLRASKLRHSSIFTKCIQRKIKFQTLNPESILNVETPFNFLSHHSTTAPLALLPPGAPLVYSC
jgi:hypothetical protein